MAALDDILAERARNEDAHLAQAAHDATWTNTFASAPSADRLRNNLNLTEMVNGAMDMKLALAARTDKNAQEIYQKGEKFKEWQDQAPLRDELLRKQIAAQGATTNYKMQQDERALEETTNFYRGLAKIPHPLGSSEHAAAVTELAAANPLALSTAAVRDDLKVHSQVHDTAALLHKSIAEFKTETGVAPVSFETTATGGVHLYGKAEEPSAAKQSDSGISVGLIKNATGVKIGKINEKGAFEGDVAGDVVQFANPKGKTNIQMSRAEYVQFGGHLADTKGEPSTTPAPTGSVAPAIPQAGEVRGGYRFKGGNPADKSNWEKAA